MKLPALTVTVLVVICMVYFSIQSITKTFLGLFDEVPANINNVETYIERSRFLSENMAGMTWEEYRELEVERVRQETRYAEVGRLVIKKLASKGQLAE